MMFGAGLLDYTRVSTEDPLRHKDYWQSLLIPIKQRDVLPHRGGVVPQILGSSDTAHHLPQH